MREELNKIEKKIIKFLEEEDQIREKSLKFTREIGRTAANSIKKIHQRKFNEAENLIKKGIEILKDAKKLLKKYPEIYYAGFLHSAEKEIIEALITLSIIRKKEIPNPYTYGFDCISFLHGLCESTGEIKRFILDEIRKGKIFESEKYLEIMDEIYFFLLNFQYPDGITRSLRRQVDYVRKTVESARSEITLAKLTSKQPL